MKFYFPISWFEIQRVNELVAKLPRMEYVQIAIPGCQFTREE